jgi:hypothetical protein
VRAYLCDGQNISEWFVGGATGPGFQLFSEDGEAQLDAMITPENALGDVTLANYESFSFEASPAEGIDVYYPVKVSEDGQVSGTSWSGAVLEGRVTDGEVVGTITPPEGDPEDFEVSAMGIDAAGEWRWIFFDGRIKGAKQEGSANFQTNVQP